MGGDRRLIEGETGCQAMSPWPVWHSGEAGVGVCGTQLLTTALGTAVSTVSGQWLRGI